MLALQRRALVRLQIQEPAAGRDAAISETPWPHHDDRDKRRLSFVSSD